MADVASLFFDSRLSVFKLYDGAVLRDMSANVKEIRGLPGTIKMNDVTAFGSTGERPGPSILINHFTVEFMFNRVTDVGSWTVVNGMWSGKAVRAFEFWPIGVDQVGKVTGNAYISVCELTSRVGDYVALHCEFHCDNGVTPVA